MSNSVYQWRPRTQFNIDPQVAGKELEKIKGHNSGEITPEAVLEAAKPTTSPLHSLFEWDDAKAAQQQRLNTANLLIKSIVVTVTSSAPRAAKPVTVSVSAPAQTSGQASARVVSETELHQAKVLKGWEDLDRWIKTYADLPEFGQIGGVLQALLPAKNKAA